jgi:hypothetical protein
MTARPVPAIPGGATEGVSPPKSAQRISLRTVGDVS